jgi:alpha-galactosidase/6-phospho-beta-glucosidase family protein
MAEQTKMAVIGGGSPFVLSLLHGLMEQAERWHAGGREILLSLYDIAPERAERWARYAVVARRVTGLPIVAEVAADRDDSLRDATLILLSAGAPDAYSLGERMREKYAFPRHSIHDGPPGFAAAKRLFPMCRELGEAITRRTPDGLLLLLPNPTDALANAAARATGAHAAGLCVEVEHLREHLAYYFGLSWQSIELDHAGVNHDGWTLRLRIDGQDGYPRLHERILALPEREDFHPGNYGMVQVYRATGALRSSAYHNWPLEIASYAGPQPRAAFGVPREQVLRAADEAMRRGEVMDAQTHLHPERQPVKYLGTGRALERLLWARATDEPQTASLQVRNDGAVANLPPDVQVEVPTVAQGARLRPRVLGALPEHLAGTTRLLAIQRKLEADYLLDGRKETLLRALMTVPTIAPVDTFLAFADELHALKWD